MPTYPRIASATFAIDADSTVTVENVPFTWESDLGNMDNQAALACAKYLNNNENLNDLTLISVTSCPV